MLPFSFRPPVARLLDFSCPLAVSRMPQFQAFGAVPAPVTQIVVPAVDGHAVRPLAHIRQETPEIHPACAHREATGDVVRMVPAAVLHRLPGLIGRRAARLTGHRVTPGVPVFVRGIIGPFLTGPRPYVPLAGTALGALITSHTPIIGGVL